MSGNSTFKCNIVTRNCSIAVINGNNYIIDVSHTIDLQGSEFVFLCMNLLPKFQPIKLNEMNGGSWIEGDSQWLSPGFLSGMKVYNH